MKKVIYTLIAVSISILTFGQSREEEKRSQSCKDWNKFAAVDRLKNYPFDRAVKVLLTSFDFRPDTTIEDHQLPEKDGRVDISQLREQTVLSKEHIDSLTHILYNIGYFGKPTTRSMGFCYDPKNAILFLDSNGRVFEFIEICFECHELRLSSSKLKTGEFCTQKYNLLKAFFSRQGIEFGIVEKSNGR
jgi:hypothetical protein